MAASAKAAPRVIFRPEAEGFGEAHRWRHKDRFQDATRHPVEPYTGQRVMQEVATAADELHCRQVNDPESPAGSARERGEFREFEIGRGKFVRTERTVGYGW